MSALGGGVHKHEGPPLIVGFGDINADFFKIFFGWRRGGTTFASVGLDVIGIDYEHGATSAAARQHTMQRNMVTSIHGVGTGNQDSRRGGVVACVYPNPSPHVPNEMHRVYQT